MQCLRHIYGIMYVTLPIREHDELIPRHRRRRIYWEIISTVCTGIIGKEPPSCIHVVTLLELCLHQQVENGKTDMSMEDLGQFVQLRTFSHVKSCALQTDRHHQRILSCVCVLLSIFPGCAPDRFGFVLSVEAEA